jgi:flavin reductase (DIM6/NTAB) family NADH-FMN oxidoreductase RutF
LEPCLTVSFAPPDTLVSDFRHAMRRLAATVTLVTTSDADGQRYGMLATSVTSVTMEPPMLLVCVSRSAHVHPALMARKRMCINVLLDEQGSLVRAFSSSLPHEERFANADWATHSGLALPFLPQAQALFFCEVDQVIEAGTHSVVLARVLESRSMDVVRPMVYVDGRMTHLPVSAEA